jgi:agmatine/peptidylarginine deiminase
VNLLLVDKTLFVPTFGLGKAEDDIVAKLAKQLPEGYTLHPVYSRHALMYNGGVHCSFGIFRSAPGVSDARGDLVSTTSE